MQLQADTIGHVRNYSGEIMSKSLQAVEAAALRLSYQDRGLLLQSLIASFQVESQADQDAVVAAWGRYITQVVAQWDGGRNEWLSACMAKLDTGR